MAIAHVGVMNNSPKENTRRMAGSALLAVTITVLVGNATAAVRYVNVANANPNPPFITWSAAARNIQDAVDAADPGDEILVNNGVYQTGGTVVPSSAETNRLTVSKALAIRSVNGPGFTVIRGHHDLASTNFHTWVRCVYLSAGASLTGFTLTNGGATSGGGIQCESSTAVVSNCVIAGNVAWNSGGGANGGVLNSCLLSGNRAGEGGGAYGSALKNCTVTGNSSGFPEFNITGPGGGASQSILKNCILSGNRADMSGGGAAQSALINCTLAGNYATFGGGADSCTLVHCTVVNNSAYGFPMGSLGAGVLGCAVTNSIVHNNNDTVDRPGNFSSSTFSHSCTTPLPTNGIGNITNAPLFIDVAGGDFRLQPGSPCIDSGANLSALISNDLAGLRRPLDGNRDGMAASDIGAYEFNPLFLTSISKVGTNFRICWFDNVPGMKLHATPSIISGPWREIAVPSNTNCIELPMTPGNAFFRLSMP